MKRLHFLIASYLVLMIVGGLWGLREKVHQSPDIFHQLFPDSEIEPVSFFGKEMWKMKYVNYSEDKSPRNFIVSVIPYNDFWHSSWYLIKTLYILGIWLAWKSEDRLATFAGNFWNFRKSFWPHLVWVTVITMFWGGFANWIIETVLK